MEIVHFSSFAVLNGCRARVWAETAAADPLAWRELTRSSRARPRLRAPGAPGRSGRRPGLRCWSGVSAQARFLEGRGWSVALIGVHCAEVASWSENWVVLEHSSWVDARAQRGTRCTLVSTVPGPCEWSPGPLLSVLCVLAQNPQYTHDKGLGFNQVPWTRPGTQNPSPEFGPAQPLLHL